MKITFSKSEPYKSGWKGWMDFVDVFVDGKQIGQLVADSEDHRKYMEYFFTPHLNYGFSHRPDNPRGPYDVFVSETGLRAAKKKLIDALTRTQLDPTRGSCYI